MSEDVFDEVGFGQNDEGIGDKVESYKGKKKEVHRISLAWWEGWDSDDFGETNLDGETPKMIACKRVYVEGAGYVVVTSPEIAKIAGSEPRKTLGTIVIKWPTNADGSINKDAFSKGKVMVLPWVFSGDKYKNLKTIHEVAGWHLGKHDVLVSMTSNKDEKYQDLTFNNCGDSLFRALLKNPKAKGLVEKIKTRIHEVATEELKQAMGRVMTPEQLREKMGSGDGVAGASGDDGAGIASGEQIEGLLDNMEV